MYALAYFFKEDCYKVIPADWIQDFDPDSAIDDLEYVVNWQKGEKWKDFQMSCKNRCSEW